MELSVNIKELKKCCMNIKEVEEDIKDIKDRIENIHNMFSLSGSGALIIKSNIKKKQDDLLGIVRTSHQMNQAIEAIYKLYELTEGNISQEINQSKGESGNDSAGGESVSSEQEYFDSMAECYGFSDEDAKAIMDAYEAFENSEQAKGLDNQEKIYLFFSNMASLHSSYSGDSGLFKAMGDHPSHSDAIDFFNDLGIDGNTLNQIVNDQHSNCGTNRDFAHECAILAVMANDGMLKGAAGIFDDVDELVGFKGDIYSKSMGMDDVKSDIAAVNIYNRMIDSEDGNIFDVMADYNNGCTDGSINPSKEFLENYGDGDAEKGMKNLITTIDDTSIATWYLSGEYGKDGDDNSFSPYDGYGIYANSPYSYSMYGYSGNSGYGYQEYGYYSGNEGETVQGCRERFLNYISEESGVSIP